VLLILREMGGTGMPTQAHIWNRKVQEGELDWSRRGFS
jgi:hypothetical protein